MDKSYFFCLLTLSQAKVTADAKTASHTGDCVPKPNKFGPDVSMSSIELQAEHVQKAFRGYESVKWKGNFKGQAKGTRAGGLYENKDHRLPTEDSCGNPITYKEFDVNDKVEGKDRGKERFVAGSDGSVYYTYLHYKHFLKIK